jgi:hypothetical protein
MATPLRIQADAETMIRPELFEGETILWAGHPSASRFVASFLLMPTRGPAILAFVVYGVLMCLRDPRQSHSAGDIAVLVILPMILVLPLLGVARSIAKICYGVTDQRVLWAQPARSTWLRFPIPARTNRGWVRLTNGRGQPLPVCRGWFGTVKLGRTFAAPWGPVTAPPEYQGKPYAYLMNLSDQREVYDLIRAAQAKLLAGSASP